MKYTFKAVKYSRNLNLFENSYSDHEAAMQAAFAYVDLYVDNNKAIEKLVKTAINGGTDTSLSFTHDDTTFIIEPENSRQ